MNRFLGSYEKIVFKCTVNEDQNIQYLHNSFDLIAYNLLYLCLA